MEGIIQNLAAFVSVFAAFISGCFGCWTARQGRKASKELEAQKNQLAFSLVRKTKFAEKEFEVLAEYWKRIGKVRFAVIQTESRGIQNFRGSCVEGSISAQLAEFTSKQCRENLAVSEELSEKEREIISEQKPEDRALYFSHYILKFYRSNYVKNLEEFVNYFSDNRIFLNLDIQKEFQNIWLSCASVFEKSDDLADEFSNIEAVRSCLETLEKALPSFIENMNDNFWKLERIIAKKLYPEETRLAVEKEQR